MGCTHYAILNVIELDGKLKSDIALTAEHIGNGKMRCTSCGVVLKEEEFKKDYNTKAESIELAERTEKSLREYQCECGTFMGKECEGEICPFCDKPVMKIKR